MDKRKPLYYEIRVDGHLSKNWSDWFEGLAITKDVCGETTICGPFADQEALFGMLAKIHALNLTLISVTLCKSTARLK
jgi:hypothetical protein